MLLAFISAGLADFCANFGQLGDERGIAADGGFKETAHIGAFPVEPDALRHHFYVFFLQARIETVIACLHAFVKDGQKLLMLFV